MCLLPLKLSKLWFLDLINMYECFACVYTYI